MAPYGRWNTTIRLPCSRSQRNPQSAALTDLGQVVRSSTHPAARNSACPAVSSAHAAPGISEMHTIGAPFFGDVPEILCPRTYARLDQL